MSSLKEPVRILQISGGMDRGGAETILMNIYRQIDRRRIQFDFISYQNKKCHYDDEILNLGGRVLYCPAPSKIGVIKFIYILTKMIKSYGPFAAVHAHTLHNIGIVLFAARLAGISNRISHSHSTNNLNKKSVLRNIYTFVSKKMIKINATNMLACSEDAARYLYGEKVTNLGKVKLVPNSINLEQYRSLNNSTAKQMRKDLGIPDDTIVLGHIGRFVTVKNHEFLISLANKLEEKKENFRIILVGDGPLREEIEKKVEAKGLKQNIKFLGIRSDIPQLMNLFDIFLLPSLYEGLPVVLVEAQAAGTHCVVSSTVTKQSDMGLNLMKYINLSEINEWTNAIKKKKSESPSFRNILFELRKRGFDVKENAETLSKLYLET